MPVDPIAVGDVIQVVIESEVLSQVCLNVLHYRCEVQPAGATYDGALFDVMNAVGIGDDENIVPKMRPLMGENARVFRIQAQRVYPHRDHYVRDTIDQDGLAPVVCNAPNLAFVLTKQGEKIGRGRSGNFHLAGVTDQHYALGFVTEAGIDLMEALADKLGDPIVPQLDAFGYRPGMFNPALGADLNWNPIVAVTPQPTVRVIRRRTVGLGI